MSESRGGFAYLSLFAAGLVMGLVQIVGQSYHLIVFGFVPRVVVLLVLLVPLTVAMAYVVQICVVRYRWDDERLERHGVFGTVGLRWAEVADLRIRRSSGESAVILTGRDGRKLRVDLHLLAHGRVELIAKLVERLDALLTAKLEEPLHRPVKFRRQWFVFTLPGSIEVGPEEIVKLGWAAKPKVRVAEIEEVAIRVVRSLLPTQDYRIAGGGSAIEFRSSVENSPLLIRHLRRRVPEDCWKVRPSGSVAAMKTMMVFAIGVMVWSSMIVLQKQAYGISIARALRGNTESASATVVAVRPVSPATRSVQYEFTRSVDGKEEAVSGGWVIHPRGDGVPVVGSTIEVQYDPERPNFNRPIDTAAFWVMRPLWQVWIVAAEAIAGILFSITVLFFQPPEDPFLPWITQS